MTLSLPFMEILIIFIAATIALRTRVAFVERMTQSFVSFLKLMHLTLVL